MRSHRGNVRQWLTWCAVLAIGAASMFAVRERLDKAHVALAFLIVVLFGSAAGGRMLGITLAGTAFVLLNWFFLPPYGTLVVADPLDWLVLLVFLITGVTAAELLARQRHLAELADRRAEEIDRIATLGAENLNAPRAEEALNTIATVIRDAMSTDRCVIFLRDDHRLRPAGCSPGEAVADVESDVLAYTVDHAALAAERADGTVTLIGDAIAGTAAGTGTPAALADLRALGVPLSVRGRVVGALRLSSHTPFTLGADQRRLLTALSYYAALGAERVRLAEAEEQTEALRRADRLKDSLLAAVSHDLRTPLTAIKGTATEIWRGGDPQRARSIEEETDRLTALVDDLLELSQLKSGSLPVTLALNTADDVVGLALQRIESRDHTGRIDVELTGDEEVIVGTFDLSHTVRALTNLLENALKYSPTSARVHLRVERSGSRVLFAGEDEGSGIAPEDVDRIYEPFYRGRGVSDGVRGTGLGLAIARQLADAQHGELRYLARPGGGSRFELAVPGGAAPTLSPR